MAGEKGMMELIVSEKFLKVLQGYINRKGFHKRDRPFEKVDWPKIQKVFWPIVNNPALLEATKGNILLLNRSIPLYVS